MTIKLVLLKSGEDVISDVSEMIVDDKVVGYFLEQPCIVKIKSENDNTTACKIIMNPWMPLSKDKQIPIVSDWVITITEPIDQVKQMYDNEVLNYGKSDNQDSSSSDQGDSNKSD